MAETSCVQCVPKTMTAYYVGEAGPVLRTDMPVPTPGPSEALVRVLRAGVCATDFELLDGYKGGYRGVLGHEFVGEVVEAASAPELVRKRVAGDLNIICGSCRVCDRGGDAARNHCSNRSVLGIIACDGTYAEYLVLPVVNLHVIPDSVSTEAATFIEPLAAACRIVEQRVIQEGDRVCVMGDGKLGLLIAEVLCRQDLSTKLTLLGRHADKMALLGDRVVSRTLPREGDLPADLKGAFDVVVDATGSAQGLAAAATLARALGKVVLKSTSASKASIDISPFVVNEIQVVGSRCGPFPDAIALLASGDLDVSKYVAAVYPLEEVEQALQMARTKGILKVQLACSASERELAVRGGQRGTKRERTDEV